MVVGRPVVRSSVLDREPRRKGSLAPTGAEELIAASGRGAPPGGRAKICDVRDFIIGQAKLVHHEEVVDEGKSVSCGRPCPPLGQCQSMRAHRDQIEEAVGACSLQCCYLSTTDANGRVTTVVGRGGHKRHC